MQRGRFPLRFAIATAVVLLIGQFLWWEIVGLVSIFLALPIYFLGLGIFGFSVAFSVSALRRRSVWPLAVNVVTLVVSVAVPWTRLAVELRWALSQSGMRRAVEFVQAGTLQSLPDRSVAPLPEGSRWLSTGGGEVLVDPRAKGGPAVLFFTYRGVLSHYSGFAYLPGDRFDNEFGCRPAQIQRRAERWYWIACR